MPGGILIDTNLLVYLVDQNEPDKQAHALRVLRALEARQAGRLSVQALAEFFNVAVRRLQPRLTPEQARRWVSSFEQVWPVFDLTPQIVLEAARGVQEHNLSYFDAQVWATARLNQVPVVFSEDFSNGQVLEGVRFANPFASDFSLDNWL